MLCWEIGFLRDILGRIILWTEKVESFRDLTKEIWVRSFFIIVTWPNMKFCDKCGSYMKKTKDGFLCRKCGNLINANARIQSKKVKKIDHSSSVRVVDNLRDEYGKVYQACPKCGNKEAFHWFSRVSGEHAGIRRERTVEHFKCTKCFHSWTRTS